MRKIFLFVFAVFVLAGCSDSNKALLEKLRTAVEAGSENAQGYTIVDMGSLTDFEWDRMYFFQGKQTVVDIEAETGVKWESGSDVPEGHNRLLFMKGNEVVSFVDYYAEEFPLQVMGCKEDRWIYPHSRSTFVSFKYCLNDKEVYAFVPQPCLENMKELINTKCDDKAQAE